MALLNLQRTLAKLGILMPLLLISWSAALLLPIHGRPPLDLEEESQFVQSYGQLFDAIKNELKCKEVYDDFSRKLAALGIKSVLITNGRLSIEAYQYGPFDVCGLFFAKGPDEWVEYDLDRRCWYLDQAYKQLEICSKPSRDDLLKLVGRNPRNRLIYGTTF